MLLQLARRSLVWARIHRVALPGVCTTQLCCKEKGEEGAGGTVCPWLCRPWAGQWASGGEGWGVSSSHRSREFGVAGCATWLGASGFVLGSVVAL